MSISENLETEFQDFESVKKDFDEYLDTKDKQTLEKEYIKEIRKEIKDINPNPSEKWKKWVETNIDIIRPYLGMAL